jgi:hypothetical protein
MKNLNFGGRQTTDLVLTSYYILKFTFPGLSQTLEAYQCYSVGAKTLHNFLCYCILSFIAEVKSIRF